MSGRGSGNGDYEIKRDAAFWQRNLQARRWPGPNPRGLFGRSGYGEPPGGGGGGIGPGEILIWFLGIFILALLLAMFWPGHGERRPSSGPWVDSGRYDRDGGYYGVRYPDMKPGEGGSSGIMRGDNPRAGAPDSVMDGLLTYQPGERLGPWVGNQPRTDMTALIDPSCSARRVSDLKVSAYYTNTANPDAPDSLATLRKLAGQARVTGLKGKPHLFWVPQYAVFGFDRVERLHTIIPCEAVAKARKISLHIPQAPLTSDASKEAPGPGRLLALYVEGPKGRLVLRADRSTNGRFVLRHDTLNGYAQLSWDEGELPLIQDPNWSENWLDFAQARLRPQGPGDR